MNDAALTQAIAAGAIDARASADEMRGARWKRIVIAAHLEPTLREIERLRGGAVKGPALIIDVSSVKVPVAQAAAGLRNFVATHPMAGTERSGISAARPISSKGDHGPTSRAAIENSTSARAASSKRWVRFRSRFWPTSTTLPLR